MAEGWNEMVFQVISNLNQPMILEHGSGRCITGVEAGGELRCLSPLLIHSTDEDKRQQSVALNSLIAASLCF